jgi:hypothetical protein
VGGDVKMKIHPDPVTYDWNHILTLAEHNPIIRACVDAGARVEMHREEILIHIIRALVADSTMAWSRVRMLSMVMPSVQPVFIEKKGGEEE